MSSLKIACLGAGSLYFPRALGDLVVHKDLAGSEIVLYDIDAEKTRHMAALGKRLGRQAGTTCRIRAATGLADAVDGADFAISSIGGSGAHICPQVYGSYYHAADMYIPARYGLFQIIGDTCGPAGMMMGFRSIPAYMRICREMEKRCPRVVLVSHSNPMAVLCRAMVKYSNIRVIGICHGVQGTIEEVGKVLHLPPAELECTWIGTNHYYWVLKVAHKGVDIFGKVMEGIERRGRDAGKGGKAEALFNCLSRAYGYPLGYPHDDHVMEFYPFPGQVRSQSEYPPESIEAAKFHGFDASKPMPRREKVTPAVRKAFFKDYQSILDGVQLPTAGEENAFTREGVAAMIAAISRGRREVFITNIPNAGAVPNLPATGLLEVEAVTESTGVRGITVGDCPPVLKGILEKRLAWHELVVDAAVQGDRNLALQALLLDEMAIRPDKAADMLDELLAASKDLLGQFVR